MNEDKGFLYNYEQDHLKRRLIQLQLRFNDALQSIGVQHWTRSQHPYLLVWFAWSRMYSITFESLALMIVKRFRTARGREDAALGVSLSIMTGPMTLVWLKETLGDPRMVRDIRQAFYGPKGIQRRSPEEYAKQVAQLRDRTKRERAYRGSAAWVRPIPDRIRLAFRV